MEAITVTAPIAAPHLRQQAEEGLSEATRRRNSVKLKFEVVAGMHRGAVLTLDGADYRIGSSPAADIVLSDPGVAPEHAVLRVEHGAVRIDAIGADVAVERELLRHSRGRRVKLPVHFTLGAAQICLSAPPRDDVDRRSGEFRRRIIRQPLTAASVLACFVLAITLVAQGLTETVRTVVVATSSAAGGSPGTEPVEQFSSGAAGQPMANAARQTSAIAEDAARELSARLAAAGIQTLRVSGADGRLAVVGKLSKQDAIGWAAIRQSFDQIYGGRIVLTTEISPAGETQAMPALQLQAIWYGEHPYVVIADGERYFQGAVLDNGWIIREIGEDQLLLAKDGETVALKYR